ncbi:hypothetical protein VSR34_27785 [Paraburkholderia sp. JHI2823]|uniref:hypothetical protein n=1 Tax=Paraburkholderia sp. JHI2823 TaxID=3112960 RepID=UPI0031826B68
MDPDQTACGMRLGQSTGDVEVNFNELMAVLRAEQARQSAAGGGRTFAKAASPTAWKKDGNGQALAKSLPAPLSAQHGATIAALAGHAVISFDSLAKMGVRGANGQPLVKALGAVPNQKIKEAASDSAARRREVPNADELLGGGKRAYRVTHGDRSLTEAEARAACERGLLAGRIGADDATRIEHLLNEQRPLPPGLVAKLFN